MYLIDKSVGPRITEVVDPFSLSALREWVATKPAEEKYNFYDCGGGCFVGQYFIAQGLEKWGGYESWADFRHANRTNHTFSEIAVHTPHTFGAALKRIDSALHARSSEGK